MSVTPCQNLVKNRVDFLPNIDTATTVTEFDQFWKQIQMIGVSLSTGEQLGKHILCKAAAVNNIPLLRHIHHIDESVLDLGDKHGCTPLFYATCSRCPDAAETLLELGANPNVASIQVVLPQRRKGIRRIPQGATSLWISAQLINNLTMTKLLLRYGGIAAPALDKSGQDILEKAKSSLAKEREPLLTAIDKAIEVFPTELLQMIVDYT